MPISETQTSPTPTTTSTGPKDTSQGVEPPPNDVPGGTQTGLV